MIDSFEFIARRQKPRLPDLASMLAKLGITPDVPHEIGILRIAKQIKQADAQAKLRPSAASRTKRTPQPAPNLLGRRSFS